MSTHSDIMIQNADGSVLMTYCHFDGYPEYMAPILLQHFDTEEKVRELIALGALSYITEDGRVQAYHRDMGRKFIPPTELLSIENGFDREEYSYLFRDGKWYMSSYKDTIGNWWTPLEVTPRNN